MLAMLAPSDDRPPAPFSFHGPRKWYALLTFSNRERSAAEWIKARSRAWIYWPNMIAQRAGGRGVRRSQLVSIIPGYLFMAVGLDDGDPWDVVHETPGIHGFVRDGAGHAAHLTEQDIDIIRRIEGNENMPQDPRTAHRFKVTDKVQFCDDLFGRWPPGLVVRLDDDGRIVVDVSLLGRVVHIHVLPSQIESM